MLSHALAEKYVVEALGCIEESVVKLEQSSTTQTTSDNHVADHASGMQQHRHLHKAATLHKQTGGGAQPLPALQGAHGGAAVGSSMDDVLTGLADDLTSRLVDSPALLQCRASDEDEHEEGGAGGAAAVEVSMLEGEGGGGPSFMNTISSRQQQTRLLRFAITNMSHGDIRMGKKLLLACTLRFQSATAHLLAQEQQQQFCYEDIAAGAQERMRLLEHVRGKKIATRVI